MSVKRAFDVSVAVVALILLLPVFAVAAAAVRLKLGSPVLFRQQRPGLHGRPFTLYKFRSMRAAHDAAGTPLPDSERLTAFGRRLRRTSLDELPELWNVLRGDMSLVGPRPLLMQYLDRYTPRQMRRHEVRPGLTGLAQVSGRNALSWQARFELDVWYVEHRSFWLDLVILARTLQKVVIGDGISQPGHDTAVEFRGEPSPDRALEAPRRS